MKNVAVEELLAEVGWLEAFSGHPSFVAYIDYAGQKSSDKTTLSVAWIVMEAATGGTLADIVQKVRHYREVGHKDPVWLYDDGKRLFADMLAGVAHMHDKGIVHRDLKPANVFVTASCASQIELCRAKVGDLGLACDMNKPGDCRGAAGTPNYIAPELLRGTISYSNDVWALGLMLYELTFGRLPTALMNAVGAKSMTAAIIERGSWSQKLNITSDEYFQTLGDGHCRWLIEGMLQQSSRKRWTARQALQITLHWIGSSNFFPATAFRIPRCLHDVGRGFGAGGAQEAEAKQDYKLLLQQAGFQEERKIPDFVPSQQRQAQQRIDAIPAETNNGDEWVDIIEFQVDTLACCKFLLYPWFDAVAPDGRVRTLTEDLLHQCGNIHTALDRHTWATIRSVNGVVYRNVGRASRGAYCDHGINFLVIASYDD